MKKKYIGWLQRTSNGEDDDLLGIDTDSEILILTEKISDDISSYGEYLSVRYFISDKKVDENEANENWIKTLLGIGESEYQMHYSDYTGYLWTDEELNVGGHDLLQELKNHLHKYIIMEIEYSKVKK